MKILPAHNMGNYSSESNLLKRKAFANYCRPKIDLVKTLVELLKLGGDEKILDVGCGNGDALIAIRNEYKHRGMLYGVDIAEGILEKAIEANNKAGTAIKFFPGDARKLKFPDNCFDIVMLKHVLHNVSGYPKAIQECHRVLKDGGKLAIVINSKKTRLIFKKLEPKIAKILGVNFIPDADHNLVLENIPGKLKAFETMRAKRMTSVLRLTKADPYLNYIDSSRDFWGKIEEKQWKSALDFSKKYLENILKKQKIIKDYVTIGVVVATK